MRNLVFFLLINTFLLSACQQTGIKENHSLAELTQDMEISSKAHKRHHYTGNTYQWVSANIVINDPSGVWNTPEFDYDAYISSKIKKELEKIGLFESKESNIAFSYDIDVNMSAIQVKKFNTTEPGSDKKTNEQLVFHIPESVLSIIIRDKSNYDILWTGSVKSDYKNLPPEIATKRIDYSISEILKRLPKNP